MNKIKLLCFLITPALSAGWAQETIEKLTLDEKIGQLFMVAAVSDTSLPENQSLMTQKPYRMDPEHIEHLINQYHIGGIIFLGAGYPESQFNLTRDFQQLSSLPLLIGQDLEWGLSCKSEHSKSQHCKDWPALRRQTVLYAIAA